VNKLIAGLTSESENEKEEEKQQ